MVVCEEEYRWAEVEEGQARCQSASTPIGGLSLLGIMARHRPLYNCYMTFAQGSVFRGAGQADGGAEQANQVCAAGQRAAGQRLQWLPGAHSRACSGSHQRANSQMVTRCTLAAVAPTDMTRCLSLQQYEFVIAGDLGRCAAGCHPRLGAAAGDGGGHLPLPAGRLAGAPMHSVPLRAPRTLHSRC